MPRIIFASLVFLLGVAVSSASMHDDVSRVHRLPSAAAGAVEARVAELQFTRKWFVNHSHAAFGPANPCPLPSKNHEADVLFGLGYDAVADSLQSASCWIMHQHRQAGNVDVDYLIKAKASLVHGAGVSELLIASIMALASSFPASMGKPIVTTTLAPYYAVLKQVCLSPVIRGVADWVEPDAVALAAASSKTTLHQSNTSSLTLSGRPLILIAIVPSNPTGSVQSGILAHCKSSATDPQLVECFETFPTRVISDHSYFWPCLVPSQLRSSSTTSRATGGNQEEWQWRWPIRPIQSSALLFGLSKLSGHSGVRHGWAWVLSADVASGMRQHLWELGTSLSSSAIAQSALVLATISMGTEPSFHSWCETTMTSRYDLLDKALPASFRVLSNRQSATALIECPAQRRGTVVDCAAVMHDIGIMATSGESFGASRQTARISMGVSEADFSTMLSRLEKLRHSSAG